MPLRKKVALANYLANKFNEFFSTVGPKLANAIPVLDNSVTIHAFLGHHNINSIFLNPISEQEVIYIVKSCKPKNSKDCDELSMYVLSTILETSVKPLAHVFNLSFSSGIFPDDNMNIAKIIPVFKRTLSPYFRNLPLLHITIRLNLIWRLLKFMQWLARKQYLLRRRTLQIRLNVG